MNIKTEIYNELSKLGFNNLDEMKTTEITNKNGIFLFRIKINDNSYVLKYFKNNEYKREINNYNILKDLGIKTITNYGYTNSSILLEDLEISQKYKLGISEDLEDEEVAKALASWYRSLHNKGVEFIRENPNTYYSEMDEVTKDNIELLKVKTDTMNNPVWDLILDNFEIIKEKIYALEKTINYNDFYWTNLVVSIDKSEAFMFDYNFLGVGFRYSDIRNVCSSLSKEAGEIFIKEYGDINIKEKIVDDFTCVIITLIFSYKRDVFPSWANEYLDKINNGELEINVMEILSLPY